MTYFYSVRGWLEVESENFEKAIAVVKSLQATHPSDTKPGLYLQGWCWGEVQVNWTRYLFYGADVTAEGLEFFQETLLKLLELELNLSGYFHAEGEDGENHLIYQAIDNRLRIEKSGHLMAVN